MPNSCFSPLSKSSSGDQATGLSCDFAMRLGIGWYFSSDMMLLGTRLTDDLRECQPDLMLGVKPLVASTTRPLTMVNLRVGGKSVATAALATFTALYL